ncbi:MAG: hypothetical protein QF689_17880 [Candidatus Latescibacteria bacterium]|nr:hypothetical protein [Gemmatimonadaceae bacterium]MDP6016102.1 hypothetical protein [Candidatus Latescibacterota bacterium]MDP7450461.1 hypothetical protein [Candidatus Latescibacterota bacterium]HJP30998.1 hypothetical protein [Candidatus Latescibacterota bacterium]
MTASPDGFWFNRLIEYWTLPEPGQVLDHVRRGHVQVVQMGNFGPDFYSLADDPDVHRSWAGMPAVGVEANLERAADLIPKVQAAGARVVGQLSSTLHYGDHETGLGLFGDVWDRMWTPALLGDSPAESVSAALALETSGEPARRAINGRPYYSYRGCISNPAWQDTLKAMVRKGIDLGLDGFNTTHNYEGFCGCGHCAGTIRACMADTFSEAELHSLFSVDLEVAEDLRQPLDCAPADLRRRYLSILEQAAARRRKDAFDAVFLEYGRSLRPGLLAAQWYHKYGMRVNDERAALPADLWGRGEDYIWYSQGPHRWGSSIEQGYIADMGLNARHMHAAGGGRPFVINKYDYRRWRVWAGEAAAHGAASPCYHAGPPYPDQEETTRIAPEDYYGPIIRYQRFLAEHEDLLHPARPLSQVGLVYPRRAEREQEADYLDALKRIAEWLEDAHVLYDILFDDQLTARAGDFPALILPDIRRLSDDEIGAVRRHVAGGGGLVVAGATGTLAVDGSTREQDPIFLSTTGSVFCWESTDWQPQTVPIRTLQGDPEMPVYSHLPDDAEGRRLIDATEGVCGGFWLHTDAPWSVRTRAWQDEGSTAIPVHWINYRQDEAAAIEVPIPVGPIKVDLQLPDDAQVDRVEWCYPEMKEAVLLDFESAEGCVTFEIPRLIVYGMSVIRLRTA